jgi:hypothetical protein
MRDSDRTKRIIDHPFGEGLVIMDGATRDAG